MFLRESFHLCPSYHPGQYTSLNELANILFARFELKGLREDLEDVTHLLREAFPRCLPLHVDRVMIIFNLARALYERFLQSGKRDNLDEAIQLQQEALVLTPPSHSQRSKALINLASAIRKRFEQSGAPEDLDEAIYLYREALALRPPFHPDRSVILTNISAAVLTRFEQSGGREDLDEAIIFSREAVLLCAKPDLDRALSLGNLANALQAQFEQLGGSEVLDEAILLQREALIRTPGDHPERITALGNFAAAVLRRFRLTGRIEDLDEVILFQCEVLNLRTVPHPARFSSLHNLAASVLSRFWKLNRVKDLVEAIQFLQEAISLTPFPHPERCNSLTNLATAILTRFKESGERADLDEAILLHRQAVQLNPELHQNRPSVLERFVLSIYIRFQKSGALEDLDETINLLQEVENLLSSGHPLLCQHSSALGEALLSKYSLTGEKECFINAINAFRVASNASGSPVLRRTQAAKRWAQFAELNNDSSCIEAYELVISLLPRLSSLGHNVRRRQEVLAGTDGLARSAAIHAISLKQYDKAIELLEAGRAIFWIQALKLRSPVDDLREAVPELEKRLSHISSELERGSYLELHADGLLNEKQQAVEAEIFYFTQLNDSWVKVLDEVRALSGFENFLQPNKLSTLQLAACDCPIVILIAGGSESHALIMSSDHIQHVLLPRINTESATNLASKIRATAPKAQRKINRDTFQRYGRPVATAMEDTFRTVLRVLWEVIVEPIVRALNLQKSHNPPIIRWFPRGILSFLPIHAAGKYKNDMSSDECASSYFVSSYSPTIGTLLQNGQVDLQDTKFNMLVVIEPKTLPNTIMELEKIEQHVASKNLVTLGVLGKPALVDDVLSHLSSASVAHFSCHGKQSHHTPLESALLLDDGELNISRIMQKRMPNAQLAFLCACETAMGDETLPDETMHLGATLLFSGFRSVIATMWSIEDQDGPVIADEFYKFLFKERSTTPPDTTQASRALHIAVAKLCSEGASFRRWVPFIHLGC